MLKKLCRLGLLIAVNGILVIPSVAQSATNPKLIQYDVWHGGPKVYVEVKEPVSKRLISPAFLKKVGKQLSYELRLLIPRLEHATFRILVSEEDISRKRDQIFDDFFSEVPIEGSDQEVPFVVLIVRKEIFHGKHLVKYITVVIREADKKADRGLKILPEITEGRIDTEEVVVSSAVRAVLLDCADSKRVSVLERFVTADIDGRPSVERKEQKYTFQPFQVVKAK